MSSATKRWVSKAYLVVLICLSFIALGTEAVAQKAKSKSKNEIPTKQDTQSVRKFFMHVRVNKCITDHGLDHADIQNFIESILLSDQMRSRFFQKGYKYENKSHYIEAADRDYVNPDEFLQFNADNINHIIANNDYAHMYLVSLACLPSGEKHKYRFIVSMIDRDRIKRLLERRKDKSSPFYNSSMGLPDAMNSDNNDLDNLSEDLVNSIYRSFFKLLHVPNLEAVSDIRIYDPGDTIQQFFQLQMNLDPQLDASAVQELLSKFRIDYSIYELSGDQVNSICSAPDANLALLDCATGAAKEGENCDPSDLERFQVRRLSSGSVRPRVERDPRTDALRGGTRVTYDAASFSTVYLFRASASVPHSSAGGDIESRPTYRCVQTRPRPLRISLSVRAGFPYDLSRSPGDSALPPAGLKAPAMGMDIGLLFFVTGRKSHWLSSAYLGPSIGFTWLDGIFPCPLRDYPICNDVFPVPRYRTSSSAWSFDIRGEARANIYQRNRFVIRTDSSIGIGIEALRSSIKPFSNDGVHPLLLISPGLAMGGENLFRTNVGINMLLGFAVEVRIRMQPTVREITTNYARAEAAGVPDYLTTFWLLYHAEFGWPHRQTNPWLTAK